MCGGLCIAPLMMHGSDVLASRAYCLWCTCCLFAHLSSAAHTPYHRAYTVSARVFSMGGLISLKFRIDESASLVRLSSVDPNLTQRYWMHRLSLNRHQQCPATPGRSHGTISAHAAANSRHELVSFHCTRFTCHAASSCSQFCCICSTHVALRRIRHP